MTIQGQSLVIIGGSSGMGLAIAKKAVEAGANVTIAARSRAKLDEVREAIAADVTTHTVDVSEGQSVKTLFSKIGPFDHLVVSGSSVRSGPLRELSLADARFNGQQILGAISGSSLRADSFERLHYTLFWNFEPPSLGGAGKSCFHKRSG